MRQTEIKQHPAPNDSGCVAALAYRRSPAGWTRLFEGLDPFARLAARQIVVSARCSMNSQTPRKLIQVLNPVSAAGGSSATLPACFARRSERVASEGFFAVEASSRST
jgi:hypothetical protein